MPYGTGTSRLRQDHVRRQSSNTAVASFDRGAEPGAWDQPEDGHQVAETANSRGSQDRTEGAALDRSHQGGQSRNCSLPAAYSAAAGRLSLGSRN